MSMAIPAISRLYEMAQLARGVFAYELLAGITAVRLRQQTPGDGVVAVIDYFDALIPAMQRDRSPAPDIETLLEHFDNPDFVKLTR